MLLVKYTSHSTEKNWKDVTALQTTPVTVSSQTTWFISMFFVIPTNATTTYQIQGGGGNKTQKS
jgi:hypothetical protein